MTEKEFYIEAGKKFKELRESKHITQDKLSHITGFDRSVISRFENSGKKISTFRMKQLLEAIDCTLADLEPDNQPTPEKKTPSISLCQPLMA